MGNKPKTPEEGLRILQSWLRKKKPAGEQLHKTIFKLALMCRDAGLGEAEAGLICKAYAAGDNARRVPEREVVGAVTSAYNSTFTAGPRFPKAMPELMAEADAFPVGVPYPVHSSEPPEFFLSEMFPGDPLICIGATSYAMDTRPLSEWEGMLRPMQFIVPSPMVAETGPRKMDGQESFHAESNTGPRKYLVTEFDGPSKPQQMARIRSLQALGGLLLACVVDSAGKSLHAFWRASDEGTNFDFFSRACRLGADERLWLRSQFARLPGGTRDGRRQEVILWQH
jgi:hypothetical protein